MTTVVDRVQSYEEEQQSSQKGFWIVTPTDDKWYPVLPAQTHVDAEELFLTWHTTGKFKIFGRNKVIRVHGYRLTPPNSSETLRCLNDYRKVAYIYPGDVLHLTIYVGRDSYI